MIGILFVCFEHAHGILLGYVSELQHFRWICLELKLRCNSYKFIMFYTRADARRPIAIYVHFLTLSLKISANQVAMTLFLKISTK